MSVEESSIIEELEEPRTVRARLASNKQPSYNEFLQNVRKGLAKKKN